MIDAIFFLVALMGFGILLAGVVAFVDSKITKDSD